MQKQITFLLSISLLTVVHLSANDNKVFVPHHNLNDIPVIPSNQVGGINAFKSSSKVESSKQEDNFSTLDLATQGNSNVAAMSGINIIAVNSKKHKKGYERPKIGLVLSGGGARGGAHLGMIQMMERHNIPIDGIVGTSMGSFIGGLYASGMSSSEIERELTTMDWTKVITFDYDRREIPFRRKVLQRDFPGKAKMGVNQHAEVVLGTGLFKRQTMLGFLKRKTYHVSNLKNFDELRIPFRSVASRLEDGHTRILRDGSLAESIYASLAIPGGFDPITINGEVLVDGGVADNLPVDVMLAEMDMDYIVVVDISTPYDEHEKFDNYLAVMGQLINILMRKNVEDTVERMEGNNSMILVRPDLTGYGSLDADKYPEIIAIGLAKGESVYNSDLSHLSLYEKDYYRYLANRPKPKRYVAPVIDRIEIKNGTYLNDEAILAKVHVPLGEKLNPEELDKDIAAIYNMMIFDDVGYEVEEVDGKNVLKIITTPSWDVNGQIKFAFGFEDNFAGHSDYFFKLEYTKFGLNSYAGEWRTRVAFGYENLILTELYQPIDSLGRFYIRPLAYYKNKKVYVSPTIITSQVQANLDDNIILQAKEYGVGSGLGVNITNDLRLEAFGNLKRVEPETSYFKVDSITATYVEAKKTADVFNAVAELEVDTLDNAFFPRKGVRVELRYTYSNQFNMEDPNANIDSNTGNIINPNDGKTTYSKVDFSFGTALTTGRHTFAPRFKFSQIFSAQDFKNSQDFGSYSTLGGLFNLSGLPTNALTGSNMALGEVVYRYRLTEDGFFGSLTPPTYIGVSLESGDAWYNEDLDPRNGHGQIDFKELKYSGSAYLAADTIIGPFYMAVGATTFKSDQYYSFYLSLGQPF